MKIENLIDIFRTKKERAEAVIAKASADIARAEQAAERHNSLKGYVEAARENLRRARALADVMATHLKNENNPDLLAQRFISNVRADAVAAAGDIAGAFAWLKEALSAWPHAEKVLLALIATAEKELADFEKGEAERAARESV